MECLSPGRRKRNTQTVGEKVLHFFGDPQRKTESNGDIKVIYKCKLCNRPINGTKDYNLGSHMNKMHNEIYIEVIGKMKDPIQVKRLKLLQNAVEMVTVNGRPFAHIYDSGNLRNIENKLSKLKEKGYALNLSDKNQVEVKEHIKVMAESAREKLKMEVDRRTLSLSCDIATLHNRAFLDVCIRYILNGQLTVRSIALIELHESHTGNHLATVIISVLKSYSIDLHSILAISTDNGANMLKMVRDLNCQLEIPNSHLEPKSQQETVDQDTESSHNNGNIDEAIRNLLVEQNNYTDDEALNMLFEESNISDHSQLLNETRAELVRHGVDCLWDITGLNCHVHTLQLNNKDAMKNLNEND